MALFDVKDNEFEEKIISAPKPVLVDFWADWCQPCKQIVPFLEAIAGEMEDKLDVAKINIEDNPLSPTNYGVRSIPTLILFVNGVIKAQRVGLLTKQDLQDWLNEHL